MFIQTRYHSVFLINDSILMNGLIILIASLALAVISQIALPWVPVPLTFQSATVILLGLTLGSKRAAAVISLYLIEGVCGLPVFAQGCAGASTFLMASGGYLWGFLPAAFLAGFMMEKGMARNCVTIFITAVLSVSVIFLCGTLHLATLMGWKKAFEYGVQPFLITEPVKLLIMSLFATYCYSEI